MIPTLDPEIRKRTLRLLTNGMYIITSRHGDSFGAATVTWVSQASFKPPLLMAAIRPESNVFRCLSQSRVAALHILNFDQQDIARDSSPQQTCTTVLSTANLSRQGKLRPPSFEISLVTWNAKSSK